MARHYIKNYMHTCMQMIHINPKTNLKDKKVKYSLDKVEKQKSKVCFALLYFKLFVIR